MADDPAEQMRIRAREVAERLRGSCRSLHDEATEDEMNDATFCAELDSHVFMCSCCEWWVGEGERSSYADSECYECSPDGDESDDEDE